MNNSMSQGIDLIWEYDILKPSFRFIVDNNPANCAPYHNTGHLLKVLTRCHEGAEYHELKGSERDELMLAALWHDYGHSQGRLKDYKNVTNSRLAVVSFLKNNPIEGIHPETVSDIIKTTQYPYVVNGADLNLRQAILRDADLMTGLEDDWFQTVILGLLTEFGSNMDDMIIGQSKFIKSVKMNSKWGKEVKRNSWHEATDNLKKLKDIWF